MPCSVGITSLYTHHLRFSSFQIDNNNATSHTINDGSKVASQISAKGMYMTSQPDMAYLRTPACIHVTTQKMSIIDAIGPVARTQVASTNL